MGLYDIDKIDLSGKSISENINNVRTLENNVFIGESAGENNSNNESYNVFIGNNSGKNNFRGYENCFIGKNSGFSNENSNISRWTRHKVK